MTSNLNPITSVRVFDIIFRLNLPSTHARLEKLELDHTMGDVRHIKRVTSVERDLNTGMYTFHVQEKFPQPWRTFKGAETFGYFKEWL